MATRPSDISTGTQVGRWTKREHELFLEGLQRFGKSWKKISSLVHTRTLVQIRTHAQKYLQKQSRAALKADAKAAAAADKNREKMPPKPQEIKQEQPQGQTTTKPCQLQEKQQVKPLFCPPQLHTNISVASMPGGQTEVPRTSSLVWKASRTGDRNSGFVPLSFPSVLSASASRVLSEAGPSSHTMSSSTIPPRSAFQLNSINKLDQLLQEDNNGNIPACVDEYYSSPTAIEDDLLRSLYSGEPQWMSRFALAGGPIGNRRRLDVNAPACASSSPSTLPVVPALRPPFSNGVFEPLPAPANLSSPSGSPTTYIQQQSEGTDKATNYPTAWI
ncbi:hypothetical protein PHYBOEH_002911 [Phytophthora boehmeriae]|uniref:Myb-like DNA-binding protein n=1 Tax=Phytophthora boehmeriae TaxID=109152 RepID=A0A8T1WRD1_9STRA|nr:hypothetical protein PHYBOEH_002911 [Phytophthora boehmeriae]